MDSARRLYARGKAEDRDDNISDVEVITTTETDSDERWDSFTFNKDDVAYVVRLSSAPT